MKKILLYAFIIMAAAQWFVPVQMLWSRHRVLNQGELFKFRTRPIDPADPFKGRFVSLSFDDETVFVKNGSAFHYEQDVYLILGTTAGGHAKIEKVFQHVPSGGRNYLKAKVNYASKENDSLWALALNFPFDEYYMNEFKAPQAEKMYRDSSRLNGDTYAKVKIYNGTGVLEGVYINDRRIEDLITQ